MSGFATLLRHELRVESRRRELLTGALLLTFVITLIIQLAWKPGLGNPSAPALWISASFAGTLALGRSIYRERDRGTWELLSVLPVEPSTIFFAKVAANYAILLLVASTGTALLVAAFGITVSIAYVATLAIGLLGLAASGTLLAAASVHARSRDVLLPVLLAPFLVPLLMMAVQATQRAIDGAGLGMVRNELGLLLAMDTIFLAIGWVAFEHLLGE